MRVSKKTLESKEGIPNVISNEESKFETSGVFLNSTLAQLKVDLENITHAQTFTAVNIANAHTDLDLSLNADSSTSHELSQIKQQNDVEVKLFYRVTNKIEYIYILQIVHMRWSSSL